MKMMSLFLNYSFIIKYNKKRIEFLYFIIIFYFRFNYNKVKILFIILYN